MKQIVAIINQSQRCEQFIKYECFHSSLLKIHYKEYGWWISRDGAKMKYWGGAEPGSNSCACGMTNSCAKSDEKCNCDANDLTLREDSGYLTDKSTLPVTELRFEIVAWRQLRLRLPHTWKAGVLLPANFSINAQQYNFLI